MSSRFRAKSFSGKGCCAATVCRTELGGDTQQTLKTRKDLMFSLVLIFLKLDPSSCEEENNELQCSTDLQHQC